MNKFQEAALKSAHTTSIMYGICTTIDDHHEEMLGKVMLASWSTTSPSGNLRRFWLLTIGPRGGMKWKDRGTLYKRC